MPLPHQRRDRAGASAVLPLPVLAALLAACCGVRPAAARGPDVAPSVPDIAAQIKRQYDSLQSLHVKWRTTVDNPANIGVDVGLFPTTVDEFAVSGKRQYRHWRDVLKAKYLNQDLEKNPQVPYRDFRFLYDGQRFHGQGFRHDPPQKPVMLSGDVDFGEETRDFERCGRALYMECIGSPYYDGGHLGPWLRQAYLGKIKGFVPQRRFSILTIFQDSGYRVREAKETVGGADCWVVELPGQDKLWLDPAKGYALVRREWNWGANRPLLFRCQNSDFKEVAAGLWLPMTAQYEAMYDPDKGPEFAGKVQARYNITVLECQANNVPEELFHFNFTPGELVVDSTRLADGKQIAYVAGQTPESTEAALERAIREAQVRDHSTLSTYIIWANVVLGAAVVAYLLVRRWRARQAAADGPSPGTSQ